MRVIDNRPGSTFQLVAEMRGSVSSGPLGRLVAKVLTSDVRKSVRNLAALTPGSQLTFERLCSPAISTGLPDPTRASSTW